MDTPDTQHAFSSLLVIYLTFDLSLTPQIHSEEDHAGIYRVAYDQGIDGTNVAIPGDFDNIGPQVMLLTNLD